jgi:hypothetical protein
VALADPQQATASADGPQQLAGVAPSVMLDATAL